MVRPRCDQGIHPCLLLYSCSSNSARRLMACISSGVPDHALQSVGSGRGRVAQDARNKKGMRSNTRISGLTTQAQRPGPRDATIATATLMPGSLQRMVRRHHRHLSLLFGGATIMTLNRSGINVSLGLLVIPLLVSGLPNLSLAALAASERLIQIKLRQSAVRVDV